MGRRTALAIAGWLVAAVAATVTGLAAVQVIGVGLTGPAGEARDADEVARLVAAPTGPSGATPAATPTGTPSGGPSTGTTPAGVPASRRGLATPGGTVVAQCVRDQVSLISWTPAQGYRASDVERGPDDDAELTFRGSGQKIEIEIHCVGGEPTVSWERDFD